MTDREKKQLNQLCEYLEGPKGCDFKEDGTWDCDGTQRATQRWMRDNHIRLAIPSHFCDCEVVFNRDVIAIRY
jgi:hypothetical protein